MISRREFLCRAGAATAALYCSAERAFANPLGLPIGFQGYDVRSLITKDWDGGWREMRKIGFQAVDLVSFRGYGYQGTDLAKFSGKEIRKELDSVGIECENCQFSYRELHENFDATMVFAHEMKLKNIICAPEPTRMKTVDDWKWQAEQLNVLGEKVERAGFRLGYHNHEIEFIDIDEVVPYDILMSRTDPRLVRFQIDVGNLTFGGKDAVTYIKKYTSRYFSMHAKDYSPGKASVPVGQGILNWREIFTAIKPAPIENIFAEVAAYAVRTVQGGPANGLPPDFIEELRESYLYLHNLVV